MEVISLDKGFICIPLHALENDNVTPQMKAFNKKILQVYRDYIVNHLYTNSQDYKNHKDDEVTTSSMPMGIADSFIESARSILLKLDKGYRYDYDNQEDAYELNLLHWRPDLIDTIPQLKMYFNEFIDGRIELKPQYRKEENG